MRTIHIHQRFPGKAFSSPVVSNTLRADLFRVSAAPRPCAATQSLLEQEYAGVQRAIRYRCDFFAHYIRCFCGCSSALFAARSPFASRSTRTLVSFGKMMWKYAQKSSYRRGIPRTGPAFPLIRTEAPGWINPNILRAECGKYSNGRHGVLSHFEQSTGPHHSKHSCPPRVCKAFERRAHKAVTHRVPFSVPADPALCGCVAGAPFCFVGKTNMAETLGSVANLPFTQTCCEGFSEGEHRPRAIFFPSKDE